MSNCRCRLLGRFKLGCQPRLRTTMLFSLNLSTRRSLVMTIRRSYRVSSEESWKSFLLGNFNRLNLNRLQLKRLIPIEHEAPTRGLEISNEILWTLSPPPPPNYGIELWKHHGVDSKVIVAVVLRYIAVIVNWSRRKQWKTSWLSR